MADFKKSWALTSINEGGYCNYSQDSGKETYRGISIIHNPSWKGWDIVHRSVKALGINNTLDAGKVIWLSITKTLAANISLDMLVQDLYKENYWNPLHLDDETDQSFADKLFDISVNQGVGIAKKAQQEAANA
jgi:lysozyme family protein